MKKNLLTIGYTALFLVLTGGAAEAQVRGSLPLIATDYSATGPTPPTSIFYDVSINTYQALSTSIGFSDKDNTQKLNLAPFKIRPDLRTCAWYCDATVNVTQRGGVYTFGLGWGYNSAAPYSSKNKRVADAISNPAPARRADAETAARVVQAGNEAIGPARSQLTGEPDADYEAYLKDYRKRALRFVYTQFWEELIRNSWQVRVTGNVQTFGVLTGTRVDLNGDGKADNAHRLRGWDVGLGGGFTPSMRSGFSVSLHHTRKRASAVEDQPLARYFGGSVTAARQVATLDRDYRDSDAFRKRLFVPSVWLGATLDHQRCVDDVEDCEERVERQTVFTPYVDLKVTPEAQFRLGLPFRRRRVAAADETVATPTFQLGFQLGGI